jgi:hypothetical protein
MRGHPDLLKLYFKGLEEGVFFGGGLWCKLTLTERSVRARALSRCELAQATSAAFHSSVIVAKHPPSLPVLNCPFLIFSASSIPEILHCAAQKRFGGVHIPIPAEKEIDCVARFVDSAV